VGDLRRLAETDPTLPRVLFVHQGSVEDAAEVFTEFWPEARAVSDPELVLYGAFGIRRGGPAMMFGPGLWRKSIRAFRKGYRQSGVQGDPWLLPAAFLVRGGRVTARHYARDAGDHADYRALVAEGTGG
jgi:hypothetical protein